jgi:hypothetical protein
MFFSFILCFSVIIIFDPRCEKESDKPQHTCNSVKFLHYWCLTWIVSKFLGEFFEVLELLSIFSWNARILDNLMVKNLKFSIKKIDDNKCRAIFW